MTLHIGYTFSEYTVVKPLYCIVKSTNEKSIETVITNKNVGTINKSSTIRQYLRFLTQSSTGTVLITGDVHDAVLSPLDQVFINLFCTSQTLMVLFHANKV